MASLNNPISIIISAYSEENNIIPLVRKILYYYPDSKIIFVDGKSGDRTRELELETARKHKNRVFIVQRPRKLGLGSAYTVGFRLALKLGTPFIFQMDADLSHNPAYLNGMIKALKYADVVIGSRYIKGGKINGWR